MKHLIPYLQDNQKAADYLRQLRWPDGIACPRCGSDAVEPRERCDNGLQRFNCVHCAARLGQQLSRQDKLGVSCRVKVPVGEGRATHPYRVVRPWRSRKAACGEQEGRSVDRASWRP